jgi:putative tryptophan/tyrosine transport system substrate-binding protein
MNRRQLLALLGAAISGLPLAASAQQSSMPTIGLLHGESPVLFGRFLELFREGLAEAGFTEGRNVTIEYRWAEGRNERLPALAADLVRRKVNVISAPGSTPAALAAKNATSTIPIVIFTAGDPVALGLVAGLNRPGENVTGATSLGRELAPKRLELLRELVPAATAMTLLVNPTNPAIAQSTEKAVQAAARALGLELQVLRAGDEADFEPAFAAMKHARAGGLVIAIDSFFTARREKLAELALRHRIPAIYQYTDFAAAGGVMSYGGTFEGYRIAGLYTGRVLKGEKPAELPVQQTTKVELIISVKNAKALGVQVPGSLLARADAILE